MDSFWRKADIYTIAQLSKMRSLHQDLATALV